MKELVKSPLNYTGGKFKELLQLLELFPKDIDVFVDLFGGGGNVSVNVECEKVIYNDSMWQVSKLLQAFKTRDKEDLLDNIEKIIGSYGLSNFEQSSKSDLQSEFKRSSKSELHSEFNKESYLKLRYDYNALLYRGRFNPVMLYTLCCYAFNNQIRFSKDGEFNMPFGKRSFNPSLRKRFCKFVDRLHEIDIQFLSCDFTDVDLELGKNGFVYCDPPYLITTASYNENGGWNESKEKELYEYLDNLNSRGIRFGMTNMLSIGDKENVMLKEWMDKYRVEELDSYHGNCNYQKSKKKKNSREVYVCNYSDTFLHKID